MLGLQRITIHFIDDTGQEINADYTYWLLEDNNTLDHFAVLYREDKDCWGIAHISKYAKSKFEYRIK